MRVIFWLQTLYCDNTLAISWTIKTQTELQILEIYPKFGPDQQKKILKQSSVTSIGTPGSLIIGQIYWWRIRVLIYVPTRTVSHLCIYLIYFSDTPSVHALAIAKTKTKKKWLWALLRSAGYTFNLNVIVKSWVSYWPWPYLPQWSKWF